jgi:HEAT repeat protein
MAAVAAATLGSAILIARQVVGKAARDALFLTQFGPAALPKIALVAAVASLVAVLATGRLLLRASPARVVPVALLVSAALSIVEWSFVERAPGPVAISIYLHGAIFGATVISAFWSLINERFDPRTAKRVVARIASGGTLGGVAGGLFAGGFAGRIGLRGILFSLTLLHLSAALLVVVVGRGVRPQVVVPRPVPPASTSPMRTLFAVPYLRDVAIVVALLGLVDVLLDWFLSAKATEALGGGRPLLEFFALFHMAVGVVTFLMQTALARGSLEKLGIVGTVAVLPASILVGSFVALQVPRLGVAAFVRGAVTATSNSLYRSGYELLFTPLPLADKRSTKSLIDVGFDRLGTAVGSGIALLVLAAMPSKARWVVLLIVAVVAIAVLLVTSRLHEGYVRALEDGLKARAPASTPPPSLDLSRTELGFDRSRLLAEIEQLRKERLLSSGEDVHPFVWQEAGGAPDDPTAPGDAPPQRPSGAGPTTSPARARAPRVTSADLDGALEAFRRADVGAIRELLESEQELDRRLVPFAVGALGDDALHRVATTALRRRVDRHLGQMVDALLDPETPFAVRRRLPRVLSRSTNPRAIEGLIEALGDERFEVRYAAGGALSRIVSTASQVVLPRDRILEAARREVEIDRRLWDAEPPLDAHDQDDLPFLDRVLRERTGRSLEHVFVLLSLVFEREPMRLALRALASDDPVLRGTALEYLEAVLPDPIRQALWPYVGDERTHVAQTKRSRGQLLEELLRSGPIDLRPDSTRKL